MNIKELQIAKAFKEATEYFLRKGKSPSFSQINEYSQKKFEKTPAGMPSFRPMYGQKYDCSNPHEYNYMLAKVKSDLDDLYDADNYFNNQLISAFNYYDTEKKRMDNTINNIHNRLDNLLDSINKPMSKDSLFDNFDDFSKIDFIGDETRNISATSAYIDLLNKVAASDTDYIKQIPLKDSTSKIDVPGDVVSNKMLSDVGNCLGDAINQAWIQEIVSNVDTGVAIRLSLELPQETEINTVKYYLQSPREAIVKLSIIDANKQVRQFKEIATRNNAEWNFNNTKVKVIAFDITKPEPDAISGTQFVYYAGAKRVSIYNNTHFTKSILVSKPYPIKQPFSQVYTAMDQILPPQTVIKYFLGIDKGDNQISWMKINPNSFTDLGILYTLKVNISQDYSAGFGSAFGDAYTLATLKENPVANTSKLYVGNNMWEVRTLSLSDTLDLRNLVTSDNISYIDTNRTKYDIPANTAIMYTTNVYCSKPSAVKVTARASSDGVSEKLYVNGISIERIDDYYTVRLATGWNQIQVLYVNEGVATEVILNAYFNDIADTVRAMKEAAQEIPYSELINGSHKAAYDKYSIVGDKVVVNYDPIDAKMDAVLEYRYTNNPSAFENAGVRVMAVFESNTKDVTPKLNNYKIITV